MQITDPIADFLTRIRNANAAKHETVDVPASNLKKAMAQILVDEGYIKRRYAQSDERPGQRHRLHIQRTDDRPPGQKAEGRRRSAGFRLVR